MLLLMSNVWHGYVAKGSMPPVQMYSGGGGGILWFSRRYAGVSADISLWMR